MKLLTGNSKYDNLKQCFKNTVFYVKGNGYGEPYRRI